LIDNEVRVLFNVDPIMS